MYNDAVAEFEKKQGKEGVNNFLKKDWVWGECWRLLVQCPKWSLNVAGNAPASVLEREQRTAIGTKAAKRKRVEEAQNDNIKKAMLEQATRKNDIMEMNNFLMILSHASTPENERSEMITFMRQRMFERYKYMFIIIVVHT